MRTQPPANPLPVRAFAHHRQAVSSPSWNSAGSGFESLAAHKTPRSPRWPGFLHTPTGPLRVSCRNSAPSLSFSSPSSIIAAPAWISPDRDCASHHIGSYRCRSRWSRLWPVRPGRRESLAQRSAHQCAPTRRLRRRRRHRSTRRRTSSQNGPVHPAPSRENTTPHRAQYWSPPSDRRLNEHHIVDMHPAIERLTSVLEAARHELRDAQSQTRKLERALTRTVRFATIARRRRDAQQERLTTFNE